MTSDIPGLVETSKKKSGGVKLVLNLNGQLVRNDDC